MSYRRKSVREELAELFFDLFLPGVTILAIVAAAGFLFLGFAVLADKLLS